MSTPGTDQFNNAIKEEVRNKADIAQFIGRYLRLKRAGRNLKGLCPFHKEKTPSFTVDPGRGIFHCFGCGKGGDIFAFLMEIEGVSFPEALTRLAEENGINIKTTSSAKRNSSEHLTISKNDAVKTHRIAIDYFYEQLKITPAAIDYLKKRGITPQTAREFRIGFAPDQWSGLTDYSKKKGIGDKLLQQCGLTVSSTESNRCYDRFRNRIMFPIYDLSGNPIAFAGRGLSEAVTPKYLNSPETLLYQKNKVLFGLHAARTHINSDGCIILVEGYMDFLALYQHGIRNVVACAGTALTPEHGHTIKRFTSTVVLVFDGDEAGYSAAERAIIVLAPFNLNVKISILPQGEDPDTYCTLIGSDKFREFLNQAVDAISFMTDRGRLKFDIKTGPGAAGFANYLSQLVHSTSDPIIRSSYIKKISEIIDVKEQMLYTLFNKKNFPVDTPSTTEKAPANLNKTSSLFASSDEGHFLAMILKRPALIERIPKNLSKETFSQTISRKLYSLLIETYKTDPLFKSILDRSSDPEIHSIVSYMLITDIPVNDLEEEFIHNLKKLQVQWFRRQKHAITNEIKRVTDPIVRSQLLQKQKEIINQYGALENEW